MSVEGVYDCVLDSPMGEQKSVLTVTVDGDNIAGTSDGAMGSMPLNDGKVDGNTMTWNMDMTVPMPMTLKVTVTVDGDKLSGSVNAGSFGDMPISGTKRA